MAVDPNAPLPAEAQPSSQQDAQPDQAGAWRSWMANPDNRTSLIQFGLALAAPMGYGETPLSHIAGAVGQAGEAATRSQELRRKDELSEANLATKQAQLESTATRAGAAASNISNQAEKLQLQQQLGQLQRGTDMYKQYQAAKLLDPTLTPQRFRMEYDALIGGRVGPGAGAIPAGGAAPQQPQQQYVPGRSYTFNGTRYIYNPGAGGANPQIAPGKPGSPWELASSGGQ